LTHRKGLASNLSFSLQIKVQIVNVAEQTFKFQWLNEAVEALPFDTQGILIVIAQNHLLPIHTKSGWSNVSPGRSQTVIKNFQLDQE
jgi:hypothetical protein